MIWYSYIFVRSKQHVYLWLNNKLNNMHAWIDMHAWLNKLNMHGYASNILKLASNRSEVSCCNTGVRERKFREQCHAITQKVSRCARNIVERLLIENCRDFAHEWPLLFPPRPPSWLSQEVTRWSKKNWVLRYLETYESFLYETRLRIKARR